MENGCHIVRGKWEILKTWHYEMVGTDIQRTILQIYTSNTSVLVITGTFIEIRIWNIMYGQFLLLIKYLKGHKITFFVHPK